MKATEPIVTWETADRHVYRGLLVPQRLEFTWDPLRTLNSVTLCGKAFLLFLY